MADLPQDETTEVIIRDSTDQTKELFVNVDGSARTSTDSGLATYSAGFVGLVPPASATDIFTITGSATKTVRIKFIQMSASTTSGSGVAFNLSIVKRSTANSGGTSTTATAVPHDSTSAAGTAVVRGYTANPTVGTLVGVVRATRTEAVTAGTSRQIGEYTFSNKNDQSIVLRGTSEVLAVNLNGASVTGPVVGCSIEWTEE